MNTFVQDLAPRLAVAPAGNRLRARMAISCTCFGVRAPQATALLLLAVPAALLVSLIVR